ncbi:hypothetical protein M5K25_001080 [Dendrobium thyrsiflorum]|uniref:Uncharacterized protein n=1 Tax=Dendrobium thyrsiflorum TaxID=117978 RepID=A0ABD0VYQ9_DENTH
MLTMYSCSKHLSAQSTFFQAASSAFHCNSILSLSASAPPSLPIAFLHNRHTPNNSDLSAAAKSSSDLRQLACSTSTLSRRNDVEKSLSSQKLQERVVLQLTNLNEASALSNTPFLLLRTLPFDIVLLDRSNVVENHGVLEAQLIAVCLLALVLSNILYISSAEQTIFSSIPLTKTLPFPSSIRAIGFVNLSSDESRSSGARRSVISSL